MKKPEGPGLTAYKVAMMRAAHQIIDHPKVFDDPVALKIINAHDAFEIGSKKQKFKTKLHKYLRAIVIARSRFAEDELSAAIRRGVRQYVILGAGLDTFAYRNPHSVNGLRIFEVDYPTLQKWKQRQIKAAGISIPETLTFTPIDFERQSLAEQLRNTGFKTDEPSFFFMSWSNNVSDP